MAVRRQFQCINTKQKPINMRRTLARRGSGEKASPSSTDRARAFSPPPPPLLLTPRCCRYTSLLTVATRTRASPLPLLRRRCPGRECKTPPRLPPSHPVSLLPHLQRLNDARTPSPTVNGRRLAFIPLRKCEEGCRYITSRSVGANDIAPAVHRSGAVLAVVLNHLHNRVLRHRHLTLLHPLKVVVHSCWSHRRRVIIGDALCCRVERVHALHSLRPAASCCCALVCCNGGAACPAADAFPARGHRCVNLAGLPMQQLADFFFSFTTRNPPSLRENIYYYARGAAGLILGTHLVNCCSYCLARVDSGWSRGASAKEQPCCKNKFLFTCTGGR